MIHSSLYCGEKICIHFNIVYKDELQSITFCNVIAILSTTLFSLVGKEKKKQDNNIVVHKMADFYSKSTMKIFLLWDL